MEKVFRRMGVSLGLTLVLFVFTACAAFIDEAGNFNPFHSFDSKDAGKLRNQFLTASVFFAGNGSVSRVIGPSGGKIENQAYSLSIPSGALTEETTITMTVKPMEMNDVPGMTPVGSKLVLEPEGISFSKPVTLVTKYDPKSIHSQVQNELTQIYYFNPSKSEWEQQKTSVDSIAGNLTTELNHFSVYAPLHVNIEMIVSRVITDSSSIRNAAIQFRNYLNDINQTANRNRFYSLYARTLLPFFNIVKSEYAPFTDPLRNAFPIDDFDQDGAINIADTYPYDPTNSNDQIAPQIMSGTPNTNVLPLNPGNLFSVTFDEPVNELSVIYAGFVSRDQNVYAPLKFVSITLDRKTVTYKNEFTLDSDANYGFYVNGITDEIGNLQSGYLLVTAIHTVDIIPPKVISMTPDGMELDPNLITDIIVTFSEPMNAAGLNQVKLMGFGEPEIDFLGLDNTNKIASFKLRNGYSFKGSSAYALKVPDSITDISGNQIAVGGPIHFFSTKDSDAPIPLHAMPSSNFVHPSLNAISIQFNEKVAESSFTGKIKVVNEQNGTEILAQLSSFDISLNTGYFTIPANSLSEKSTYQITVMPGISDMGGNLSTLSRTFQFKTTDITPPKVLSVSPNNDLNLIYFSGLLIKVQFDEMMSKDSLESNPIVLHNITRSEYNSVSVLNYDPVTNIAIYEVSPEILGSYEEYEYTVPNALRDFSGHLLSQTRSGYFTTTADQLVTVPPYLSRINLVSCGNKVRLRTEFSRKMNFAAMTTYHSAEVEFSYFYPNYSRKPTGFNDFHTNNSNCDSNDKLISVPNQDFMACLSASKLTPLGLFCWLLPTTHHYTVPQPGICRAYFPDSYVTGNPKFDLRSVNLQADGKSAVFSTNTSASFKVIPENTQCQFPNPSMSTRHISGVLGYWTQPQSLPCDEKNVPGSLQARLRTHDYSESLFDLNDREFRFIRNGSYTQYFDARPFSFDPKSNECTN